MVPLKYILGDVRIRPPSAVSSAITFDIYEDPAASSAPFTTDNGHV